MLKDCWDYIVYFSQEQLFKRRKKKKRFLRQKLAVLIAGILWLVAAANMLWRGQSGDNADIISAFSGNTYMDLSARIYACGEYGTIELADSAKELILEKAAQKIGISRYEITDSFQEDYSAKILTQSSVNGDVACKFVTLTKEAEGEVVSYEQYVSIEINLKNTVDASYTYEKIVKEIMQDLDIETEVTVNLKGALNGRLSDSQQKETADYILKAINAKSKQEYYIEDAYTVYAYDSSQTSYYKIGKDKVNVNVCITYNEAENITQICLATPIQNQDY
jgi:hypothetical protein